jgi:hypothetical protein
MVVAVVMVIAVTAALGACREETIDKPTPPSMNDVLDAFTSPSGTFDAASAAAILSALDSATTAVLGNGIADRIANAIQQAVGDAQDAGRGASATKTLGSAASPPTSIEVGGLDVVGEGVGRITRICDGWGPEPVPDQGANGDISLTFTFTKTRLDPVVWGNVERCLYLASGRRLRFDRGGSANDLRAFVGEVASLEALAVTPLTLALDVGATVDDLPTTLKLAVRFVYQAKDVEVLVPVPDGSVVVSVTGASTVSVLSVRARNGTFSCDLTTKRCMGAGGEVQL